MGSQYGKENYYICLIKLINDMQKVNLDIAIQIRGKSYKEIGIEDREGIISFIGSRILASSRDFLWGYQYPGTAMMYAISNNGKVTKKKWKEAQHFERHHSYMMDKQERENNWVDPTGGTHFGFDDPAAKYR